MKDFLGEMQKQAMVQELEHIYAYNEISRQFGVSLSKEEIKEISLYEKDVLKENRRFSFEGGIIRKIIEQFCDSAYIYQDNYEQTLCELIRIFYVYKNESKDLLSDDELIDYMRKAFETTCQGDLDYLEGSVLDKYIKSLHR